MGDAPSKRIRVLLVDDDETWTCAMERSLRLAGFDVMTAASFEPALKSIEGDNAPDCLVTDVYLPAVNGVALGRMAKLRRPNLVVVHVTGYDVPADLKNDGAIFLQKPVSELSLIAIIEEQVGDAERADVVIASGETRQFNKILLWHLMEMETARSQATGRRKAALAQAAEKVEALIREADGLEDAGRLFELRAEECRTMADNCQSEDARLSFESLARSYQRTADKIRRDR